MVLLNSYNCFRLTPDFDAQGSTDLGDHLVQVVSLRRGVQVDPDAFESDEAREFVVNVTFNLIRPS